MDNPAKLPVFIHFACNYGYVFKLCFCKGEKTRWEDIVSEKCFHTAGSGSGEIWGYRKDKNMTAEVRRAATPILNADNPVGQWNRFEIAAIGDRVTVLVNGKTVIRDAQLPEIPERGPIALQHHGDTIQFANIYIKELD